MSVGEYTFGGGQCSVMQCGGSPSATIKALAMFEGSPGLAVKTVVDFGAPITFGAAKPKQRGGFGLGE
jgi:hypothetical protein